MGWGIPGNNHFLEKRDHKGEEDIEQVVGYTMGNHHLAPLGTVGECTGHPRARCPVGRRPEIVTLGPCLCTWAAWVPGTRKFSGELQVPEARSP